MGEMRNSYSILVGEPEGNRLLGRPKHEWENDIKSCLKKIGSEGLHWIHSCGFE